MPPTKPATARAVTLRDVLAHALVVFAGVVAVWVFGWLLIGDAWLPIRWGAYVGPWIGLAALFGIFCALLIRRWWLAALMTILALLILAPVLPRFAPARWFARDRPADVRVLTFNVSEPNTDYAAMARVIVAARPDVVLLQQIANLPALRDAIRKLYGHLDYSAFPAATMDTAILSRFPLTAQKVFDGRTTAVIAVGSCRIRLWDLHAPHGHYTVADQVLFFRTAADAMRDAPSNVIAGGDLNSTEYNSVQGPLRDQLGDAYADAGFGLGLSFPSRVRRFGMLGRLFAIDHIFYRGAVTPVFAGVLGDGAGSDHFPVLAGFDLAPACR